MSLNGVGEGRRRQGAVGQSRVAPRGEASLAGLQVTLENEEPEDATHLPRRVRSETSSLGTASPSPSPSLKVPVAPGPYCKYSVEEQLYW